MTDVFVAYHYADQPLAARLTDLLQSRLVEVGRPVELWGCERLLPIVDQGLVESHRALVIISRGFLELEWQAKVLDGLAARRRVIGLIWGVDETDVAAWSRSLSAAVFPGSMADELLRIVRRATSNGQISKG